MWLDMIGSKAPTTWHVQMTIYDLLVGRHGALWLDTIGSKVPGFGPHGMILKPCLLKHGSLELALASLDNGRLQRVVACLIAACIPVFRLDINWSWQLPNYYDKLRLVILRRLKYNFLTSYFLIGYISLSL